MPKLTWNLKDDLASFDIDESGARPGTWDGRDAVYMDGFHTIPVLLRDDIPFDCYRIQTEVAIPGQIGFIGLVFGARGTENYEMIYLSPNTDEGLGEIQYDPIMNGSSTWQIYNGPSYQAPASFPAGQWTTFALEVQPHSVAVYVGDSAEPQLVVANLQHGPAKGKIGFWGNFPGYIRNFSVDEIEPQAINPNEPDLQRLANESYVTEWLVSKPYAPGEAAIDPGAWSKAVVEENGCLNINRLYSAADHKGAVVQAKCSFLLTEETEKILSIGFSDSIRLWVNDNEVYQGTTIWDPPGSDGRIRAGHVQIPVRWTAGVNSIRAEVVNLEGMFGWGFAVKTTE
ncbi:hypothetical protein AB6A23_04040 [Paenibacillus tarimensis]